MSACGGGREGDGDHDDVDDEDDDDDDDDEDEDEDEDDDELDSFIESSGFSSQSATTTHQGQKSEGRKDLVNQLINLLTKSKFPVFSRSCRAFFPHRPKSSGLFPSPSVIIAAIMSASAASARPSSMEPSQKPGQCL